MKRAASVLLMLALTVLFLNVFVGVGDSTTLWRGSSTENLFVSPVSSALFLRLDLCA